MRVLSMLVCTRASRIMCAGILLANLLLAFVSVEVVHAAAITVSSTADVIANDGQCTLREAIIATNTHVASGPAPGECPAGVGTDTITLPAGLYLLSIPGQNEDNALTGDLNIKSNLTINGAGSAATVIDGGAIDRVLNIAGGFTVIVSSMTIRNGDKGLSDGTGGGILNAGYALTISNSTISGNTTRVNPGGGIFNAGGSLSLVGSTVRGNTTSFSNPGGGIFNAGGSLSLIDSTVSGNMSFGGGGIFNDTGTVQLTNSIVSGNTIRGGTGPYGSSSGGGIESNTGAITLTDSTVSGNNSGGAHGGGIFSRGPLLLTNTTVSGNTTNGGSGSGSGIYSGVPLTLINSTIRDNTSAGGAAVACDGSVTVNHTDIINNAGGSGMEYSGNADQNLTLIDSTVSGNAQSGVRIQSGNANIANDTIHDNGSDGIVNLGTLTLVNSIVANNHAGGVFSSATMSIMSSTISGNAGFVSGGGIYNQGIATIMTSTISGNSANSSGHYPGGGVYNTGTLTMLNSTISGNSATSGGGIASDAFLAKGVTTLVNVTIAANSTGIQDDGHTQITLYNTIVAKSVSGPDCTGVIVSAGYNLDDDASCNLNHTTDISHAASQIGPLANNGGPTQTHALLPGSPAIDAGGTSANGCPATDQRGTPRPQGAACDIGAFEVLIAQPAPSPRTVPVSPPNQPINPAPPSRGVAPSGPSSPVAPIPASRP